MLLSRHPAERRTLLQRPSPTHWKTCISCRSCAAASAYCVHAGPFETLLLGRMETKEQGWNLSGLSAVRARTESDTSCVDRLRGRSCCLSLHQLGYEQEPF